MADSKKIIKKIHLWLSVPFGLIITVVCLSGAALVFEEEITAVCRAHLHRVSPPPGREPLPVAQLTSRLARHYGQPVVVNRVVKDSVPDKAYLFIITAPRRGAIWVDQYTGKVKDSSGKLPFFAAMLSLHRNLMIPAAPGGASPGRIVVGLSVVAFILALLSGIAIWVPKHLRQWRLRGNLVSLHTLPGIYALLFLLLMAVTGLTWSFGWWRDMVYAIPGMSRGLVTTLHMGTYWGLTSKIIAFVAAIIGATLPLTGYWIWLRKIK